MLKSSLLVAIVFFSLASRAEAGRFFGKVPPGEWKVKFACRFFPVSRPDEAVLYLDAGSSGVTVVDGKTVRLEALSSDSVRAKREGQRFTMKYAGKVGGKTLRVVYSAHRVANCQFDGEPCESSRGRLLVRLEQLHETRDVIERCGRIVP